MNAIGFRIVLVTLLIGYLLMPILAICLYSVSLTGPADLPSEFTLDIIGALFAARLLHGHLAPSGISLVSVAICVLILLASTVVAGDSPMGKYVNAHRHHTIMPSPELSWRPAFLFAVLRRAPGRFQIGL